MPNKRQPHLQSQRDELQWRGFNNRELARYVAALYDQKRDYQAAYYELCSRIGTAEAERMVDLA